MQSIQKFFQLQENYTSIRTELSAGLATFLTMSYIIFVQPQVLGAAGMNSGAVFTATCISSALACVIMGLAANYPIAQAPIMGENFFFTYAVVIGMGIPWQKALGLVFLSGVFFLLLNLTKLREELINSIPNSLKCALSCGIGLFIAFIGFKEAGIIVGSPATFVKLGPITEKPVLIALAGTILTMALFVRKTRGSILIGLLFTALIGWLSGLTRINGIISSPPSLEPTFMKMDLTGIFNWNSLSIILIFLFITVFDTLGTLVGLGLQAGLIRDGKLPRASQALISDAVATTVGACLGTSTVSSYIESATGIAEGGKTGLTAVTVGVLFLLSLFFAPIVCAVGGDISLADKTVIHPITAPALILVGALMLTPLKWINWEDTSEAIPAFLTMALIPFTFNIADGIAIGFISYPLIKTANREFKRVSKATWIMAIIFIMRYIFL